MTKEKIFLIILLAVVCLFSAISLNKKISEKYDMDCYHNAIEYYNSEEYQKAYYEFGKVSGFSILKQASLFRQARCATNIGDTQGAIKNYNILLKRFPNTPIYAVSEYNLALILFEKGDYNLAKKHFKHIVKRYKDTEVAIASDYYIGMLNGNPQMLLDYIKNSPTGRHSQDAIETLEKFKVPLSNDDNLIIANSFLQRGKYSESIQYFQKTTLAYSWANYAKALFKCGKYNEAKSLTIKGLKYYSTYAESKDIYDVIDCFISLSDSKQTTINYLLSVNTKSNGADYLLYLLAQQASQVDKIRLYERIYTHFPNGQFSGEALYKTFYSKLSKGKYDEALKLGKIHTARFSKTNSAPAVMYWMAKIYEKRGMEDFAKNYYKALLAKYPDSYYSMRANVKLQDCASMFEKRNLEIKPIVFPAKNKTDAQLAIKLAQLGDYEFVRELYRNDEFVDSWIEYKKGHFTQSVLIAREAMEKLDVKPNYKDTRWRLVYPIHYYDYVLKYAGRENPVIILSIIKEESHFNPNIISPVGAIGLMQLMPATANEISSGYGLSNNLYNPENNIRLGSLYYSRIKQALSDKNMSAIMAYNGGYGSVMNWKNNLDYKDIDDFVEKIPYPETQDYLKKVLKSYWNYTNIYK